MTNSSEIDKQLLGRRPEFRSLLDQLEAKIEHDIGNPYALDSLTLRLWGLAAQQDKLGRRPEKSPKNIADKAADNRARFWSIRRKGS